LTFYRGEGREEGDTKVRLLEVPVCIVGGSSGELLPPIVGSINRKGTSRSEHQQERRRRRRAPRVSLTL
jgi:hypothetical protein